MCTVSYLQVDGIGYGWYPGGVRYGAAYTAEEKNPIKCINTGKDIINWKTIFVPCI